MTVLLEQIAAEANAAPRKGGDVSNDITVMGVFDLLPTCDDVWLATWRELGQSALTRPGCLRFRLLRNHKAPTRPLLISTWDKLASFDRFVRAMGLVWLERNLPYSRAPTRFLSFECPSWLAGESALDPPQCTLLYPL